MIIATVGQLMKLMTDNDLPFLNLMRHHKVQLHFK